MAVAFDAKILTTTDTGAVNTVSNTTLTVGSGSNRALIAMFAVVNGGVTPTGLTCFWDTAGTNQSCAQIPGAVHLEPGLGTTIIFFGLVNPTSGNKTLTVTWTGAAAESHLSAVSFTGVNQTGGATSFPNGTGTTATATSASQPVTSAVGNIVVAGVTQRVAAPTSTNNTTIDLDLGGGGVTGISTLYGNGAPSVTCNVAWNGASATYAFVGTDILAAAVGDVLSAQVWM